MSERKKRLGVMVVGVMFFCLIAYGVGVFFMNRSTNKMKTFYKSMEGIWSGENQEYSLEIYRVTSAHLVASIRYLQNDSSSVIFAATMERENQYRFALEDRPVNVGDSAFLKKYGVITLQEKKVRLQMSGEKNEAIEYDKELIRREPPEEKKNISLTGYMDKKTDVPGDCSVGKNSKGEIKMIQNSLEENEYNYNLGGINRYCFEADCENLWGNAIETISLDNGTKKVIYKENGFIYTISFDSFGLVCELLCMKDSDAYRKEGDFLLDGDTVVKYLGYDGTAKEINFPKGAKKIASGAFTQSSAVYQDKNTRSSNVNIPAGIEIERDAFRHCGKMNFVLLENREVIPEGAFAHLVPNDLDVKETWVHVLLPASLVTIQKDAFNQDEGTVNWPRYIREIRSKSDSPVVVENWSSVKEIAENSLRGIAIVEDSLYANENLTSITGGGLLCKLIEDSYDNTIIFFVPNQVKVLKKGAIQMMENDNETFPNSLILSKDLEKIEEESIVPMYHIPTVMAYEESKYFMNNELDWLYSKDGDDLYTVVFGGDSYFDMIEDGANTVARTGPVDKKYRKWFRGDAIQIPSGVKNIHSYALSGLCVTESWKKIRIPSSVKKMSRNALYSENYHVYFEGDVPEFYGEISQETWNSFVPENEDSTPVSIYVKKGNREKFIQALLSGQNVTEEQKKIIEDRVKER